MFHSELFSEAKATMSRFNGQLQKRTGAYLVDGFCPNCNAVFEVIGCYWRFCPCQELNCLFKDEIEKGVKKNGVRRIPTQFCVGKWSQSMGNLGMPLVQDSKKQY